MSKEHEQRALRQMRTGTLIRRMTALSGSTNNLRALDIQAIEQELNDRFAAFDSRYAEDLRQMATMDYEERKT